MLKIETEAAIAEFRKGLTGAYGLELVRQHGRVHAALPVGLGKSVWMDKITVQAISTGEHDLVVVLAPTWDVIRERQPLCHPPEGIRVVAVHPRKDAGCPADLEKQWRRHEETGLTILARRELCGDCPKRPECQWLSQYGEGLKGAQIVYAPQEHLNASPLFISKVKQWTGAKKCLVLLDESKFIARSQERSIKAADLERFAEVLRSVSEQRRLDEDWQAMVRLLAEASTEDLQPDNWKMPPVDHEWGYRVQEAGWLRFGEKFKFLAYDLVSLGLSDSASRLRDENGDLSYRRRPCLGDHLMIFSGTTDTRFADYRFDMELSNPFKEYQFRHSETRVYNIAHGIGMKQYFKSNSDQILDFFAQLMVKRLSEGRRPLLVCKKTLKSFCTKKLKKFMAELGREDIKFVGSGWTKEVLADPSVVPVIHYGVIGINLFEDFDAAYCLNGYYVTDEIVNACLQDVVRKDLRMPIEVRVQGRPRRRRAGVAKPEDMAYDIHEMAQLALEHVELEPVIQAVGRVRFFTWPREIITFQMGQFPGIEFDQEFSTLDEARQFFGVKRRSQRLADDLAGRVGDLRARELTQVEVATQLGICERTVRRHETRNRTMIL